MNEVFIAWIYNRNDERELRSVHSSLGKAEQALLDQFIEWVDTDDDIMIQKTVRFKQDSVWVFQAWINDGMYEAVITSNQVD